MIKCSIAECEDRATSKGFCDKHYTRLKRHGDPTKVVLRSRKCSIDGCNRKHHAKSFCKKHYVKFLYFGDPTYGREHTENFYRNRLCSIEDCGLKHFARGLCNKHYHRAMKNGSTELMQKRRKSSKLTEEQVLKIANDNRLYREIAKEFNVTKANIHLIKAGLTWSWITGINNR